MELQDFRATLDSQARWVNLACQVYQAAMVDPVNRVSKEHWESTVFPDTRERWAYLANLVCQDNLDHLDSLVHLATMAFQE